MAHNKIVFVIGLLLLTALSLTSLSRSQTAGSGPVQAAQGENAQVMQALLSEVHQLRLAIQRSNLNTYHAQIAIERMRLQQQRVDRVAEQLRETRDRGAQVKEGQAEMQEEQKRMEQRLNQLPAGNDRAVLSEQQGVVKTRIVNMAQEETRLREQESQLSTQLQIEQAKLAELNEQLDALQRELQIPPAENKPAQSGKRP